MASSPDEPRPGAPREIHLGPKKRGTNWLAWLLLLLGLLALAWWLFNRSHHATETAAVPVSTAPNNPAVASEPVAGVPAATLALPGGRSINVTRGGVNEQLSTYLAGQEAAPRTFQFDKLNFDSAKADIRDADRGDLDQMADILGAYPNTRIRVVGYADARGSDPANAKLGAQRADAVKAALVAKGVDAGRIETASGGEEDPVATNATAGGRFENRRTDVVVTAR